MTNAFKQTTDTTETTEQILSQPLTTEHIQAMLFTLSAELAARCINGIPTVQPHITAGAGVELLVTLQPAPAWRLYLVDSDQSRRVLAGHDLAPDVRH